MTQGKKPTFGTGGSSVVENCQICDNPDLKSVLFLGYLPPVNGFRPIGERPQEQPSYPAELLYCGDCDLVQLGLVVDPKIIFPPEYPYTSSTTRILRENFAELYQECKTIVNLEPEDLIVDIGSNDGNLLSNFREGYRVLGITPEDIGKLAIERGIPTMIDYFSGNVVDKVVSEHGRAKVVTATNVFAHIENVNTVTEDINRLLTDDGMFISESHYLLGLLKTLQYDTIYHEHLRYYSLHSLENLLERNGLQVIHARKIPTHGGSIRVYAAREGQYPVGESVQQVLDNEDGIVNSVESFREFGERATKSKQALHSLLYDLRNEGGRIWGISAPSRATTLINYIGIDDGILGPIVEIPGSHKIGKYIPGTRIPVIEETHLYQEQPEYALMLSWHIADELAPKLWEKGFKGKFIIPLPKPRILEKNN
jgi:hypothetical protein